MSELSEPSKPGESIGQHRMYSDLAAWWPLLSHPDEYAEEAALAAEMIRGSSERPVREVLELGSGGGNNAGHLKAWFDLTLSDLSPEMLEVSRAMNPECEHVQGDMRTMRLGREFDAVFVHDAVMYMTTEEDLLAAMVTAREHLRPGGVVLITPDYTRELFEPGCSWGGRDGADGRSLRYLEWTHAADPDDTRVVTDYAIVLREADGRTEIVHDHHVDGVFARDTWLRLLAEAGFREPRAIMEPPEVNWDAREVFVGLA